jgi:hypothetical protein
VLGVLAFAATYGLMLFEGQVQRPAFYFYPWLLAVLTYLAGDLLALVWFRAVAAQIGLLLRKSQEDREAVRMLAGLIEDKNPPQDKVEIVRPPGPGGR